MISGRVQGVCYRYWTRQNADRLGLAGWVRNRQDGTVEAVFSGVGEQVDEMLRLCRRGPDAAFVTRVNINLCAEPAENAGFSILATR